MKAYIVYYVSDDSYGFEKKIIEKVFTTVEKAEQHKTELEHKHKDDIKFNHGFWWYEIDTIEVE
jgi:uncharacterized protein YcfL